MKLAQHHAQLVIEQERLAMESKGKNAEDKMNEAIEKERIAEAKVLCVYVSGNANVISACNVIKLIPIGWNFLSSRLPKHNSLWAARWLWRNRRNGI
jgi:hypothetical protein